MGDSGLDPKGAAVPDKSREEGQARDDLREELADLDRAGLNLRSILDSMSDGVVVADKEGRFVEFNRAAERILGVGQIEAPPTEWAREYGLFLSDQKTVWPMDRLPLVRAIQGEDVNLERMYVCRRGSAEGRWISVNARPLRDPSGAIAGGVAVFRDITDFVRSERTIRNLSNAVEEAADPVFMTDRQGQFVYVNPAFEKVTGYSRDDVAGRTPRILKSGQHDAAFYKNMWDTILGGDVFRGSTVNRRKSGELFHAEQTITPIRDEHGRIFQFVAIVKDLTERRQAQAQEIEMDLAATVQERLYPQSVPGLNNCDIAGATFPATTLCGDYFDYLTLKDRALGIVLGDVTGHGLGPALVMAETRAYLRSLALELTDLGQILTRINDILKEDLLDSAYVALIMVQLDPESRYLSYCNAGHLAGYLLTSAGGVKAVLRAKQLPLGLFAEQQYACSERIALEPGDMLLLFTDGIVETESGVGDEFGQERVLQIAREHRNESSQAIIDYIFTAAREYAGGQDQVDDMTIVVCKVGQ